MNNPDLEKNLFGHSSIVPIYTVLKAASDKVNNVHRQKDGEQTEEGLIFANFFKFLQLSST